MKNRIQKSSPISTKERIESLDIIRGFALFGILFVNMPLFQSPKLIKDLYMMSPELSPNDQFLRMLLDVLVEAKFFTIFSFLFGVGFYIFMERAENKTEHFYLLYSRRLIVLAIFGFLHLCFFWYGDILLGYALAGFFLIFFYKRKGKTILLWLMAFSIALIGLLSLSFLGSTDSIEQQINSLQKEGEPKVEEAIDVYQNGSYFEWLSYRFSNEVIPILMNIPSDILTALFMFLIGLYAIKRGIFRDFSSHKQFVQRVWLISLLCSIPFSVGIILLHVNIFDFGILNEQMIQSLLIISGLSLSFFYISTILLLLERKKWKRILHPFSYVGRMALTNYIIQTLVGVGLFTGLGMFGEANIGLGIMISFIVFPLQMVLSFFWLKHFRFGPLEWVWRSCTYGEFQPMKLAK
ncbi:DUF418 domain-containing protein [Pseudogracilibacillus sp. SO30301A]|uniref:DUF418 domain-containing protein n=1 Tax=Pseudogracilibacillus sp. SO30301A TaxID=3098291 RepID=UPI00300E3E5C